MENPIVKLIENSEMLINHFGYWPTFHDDEIKEIHLIRKNLKIEVVISSNQKEKACDIDLVFANVSNVVLEGFNHQNVILSVEIKLIDGIMSVEFLTSFGVEFSFKCKKIIVKSIK